MSIDISKAEAYLLQAGWKCKSRTGDTDWERPTDPPRRKERKGPDGKPIIVDGVPVTKLVAPIQWPLYTLAQALEIQQGIDRDAGKTSPDLAASTTPEGRGGKDGNETPATSPPDWENLGDTKQAILEVLCQANGPKRNNDIASKAGYSDGTLRHHYGDLQTWNYISKTKEGYILTEKGKNVVPADKRRIM